MVAKQKEKEEELLRELKARLASEFFVLTAPNTDGRALTDFCIRLDSLPSGITPSPMDDPPMSDTGYFARSESVFNGAETPACVVYVYRDDQGRRCTEFICTCEGGTRDRNGDAELIAKLLWDYHAAQREQGSEVLTQQTPADNGSNK